MEQVLNPHKEQSELDVMVWGGKRAGSKAMALLSWAAACWHLRDMIEAITAEQNSQILGHLSETGLVHPPSHLPGTQH